MVGGKKLKELYDMWNYYEIQMSASSFTGRQPHHPLMLSAAALMH